ncbi:RNA-binding protein 44 [Falco cherrug]|uniref:RNA-binding protein 44 n=1 Tax=Falco cherrug TaxID=345164 RepID=UPI002479E7BF|nr:RNA-binding protein 44 [Falco cherrug]
MELENSSDVNSKRKCISQTSHLVPYCEEAECTLVRGVEAGANHSGFGQEHSANVSELKLAEESLPYLSSSLDADIDMYNTKIMRICCAEVDVSKKEADVLEGACDNEGCHDSRQSHLSEDSEYLSVHEQDFDDRNSSVEFSEPRETIGIETLKLIDPVREVPGDGVTQEQNLVDVSQDCSPGSEYGVGDQTCPEAAVPALPHLFRDSLSLPNCNGMTCDHQEEQAEYHSGVCGSMLGSHSCGNEGRVWPNLLVRDSIQNGEVKDTALIDGTLPPQIFTSEEVSEKNDGRIHSISVKQDNPLLSPREEAPAEAMQFCECARDSDFYSCEESGVCAHGTSCTDCTTKDAETQFAVSEILTSKNIFFGVEVAEESSHGKTSCLNSELEHHETLKSVASDSMINQAVDASSDFRACFTTSRSTSAQVCVSSMAINTEITMMNKSRPVGRRPETCADVACNTDWSCGEGSTEEIQSQLTDMLKKHAVGNTATAESSQTQEHQESKNELRSSGVKISTDSLVHLDKKAVKNSASSYCQKILQRAIEAELEVLNTHYQMCYQHCLKIYKLALEENTDFSRHLILFSYAYFNRCNGNTKLYSSLMSVLEELRKNYNSMRTKIKMGISLNALPPLSVEIKLFPISSSYVPCKLIGKDLCYDSVSERKAVFEAPKLQEKMISVDMDCPQTVCSTAAGQPSHSSSSKTFEKRKGQDTERDSIKKEEGNEYWFDAKEDVTIADSSVTAEEKKKQKGEQDMIDLRAAKTMESGNEYSFIRVGGLCSSVSEGDLRSHFQKYGISDTLISVDSGNCRYAFLSLKDTNKAKLAVEEMNQKKIKGKPVSVELVNTSSQTKYSVSQVLTNKLWQEIQPVDNGQRNSQDKTLTSASNSVKAIDTTSASENMHLLPMTSSKVFCSAQVPSETKCPAVKSSPEILAHYLLGVNKKDTGEKFLQKTSAPFSTNSYNDFISPDAVNSSSFTKLLRRLQEIHPEASRAKIVSALLEVRKNNKGILSGLSISSIVERTSVILRKSTPTCGWEKQCKAGAGAGAVCAGGPAPAPSTRLRRPRERSGARGRIRPAGPLRAVGRPGWGRGVAAAMALLPRRFLCFVLAHHFIAVTACQEADYGWMIRHYCLKQFQLSMEGIGQRLWCDWDETVGTYGELTNCTALIAERLDCYWPNRLVDEFFVAVHKQYFRNCSPSGRALHDPPNSVLCPFILLPVLVTLLMTALVVWRSKRSEGIV